MKALVTCAVQPNLKGMGSALWLLPGLALIAQAQEPVRFHAPEAWSHLQVPAWPGKQIPPYKTKLSPSGIPTAVVEIRDRDPDQEFRDFTLQLTGQVRDLLQLSIPSLHGLELGAFMAEATKAHPDFSKALLDTTIEFWHPRPLSLSGDSSGAGPIGGSHDTSRRGPFGR
jgi:hypothetical protein